MLSSYWKKKERWGTKINGRIQKDLKRKRTREFEKIKRKREGNCKEAKIIIRWTYAKKINGVNESGIR